MKQLISQPRKKDLRTERLAVLRLELDYELAVLFEALENKDSKQIDKSKEKLEVIREEMIFLKTSINR
jgi:hypothetical protein